MITRDDVVMFTEGCCHMLACAIHDITGWPVYSFIDSVGEGCDHAFVRMPDGRFLDVRGVQTEQELLRTWYKDMAYELPVGEVDPAEFERNGWGMHGWFEESEEEVTVRAEALARFLVASVSLPVA